MNNEEYNKIYNDTYNEISALFAELTQPTKYIDTKGMSKKEKEKLIIDLQDKINSLEIRIKVIKSTDRRLINGLIDAKYKQAMELLNNPILTLPSGNRISFSSLNDEQLEYLEQLSSKKHL